MSWLPHRAREFEAVLRPGKVPREYWAADGMVSQAEVRAFGRLFCPEAATPMSPPPQQIDRTHQERALRGPFYNAAEVKLNLVLDNLRAFDQCSKRTADL